MQTTNNIKIAIADDQKLFRSGLISLLNEYNCFDIIFEAGNGLHTIQELEKNMPDVLLLDIEMPVLNGLEACRLIRQKWAELKIIMLTIHDNDEFIYKSVENGSNAYLLKSYSIESIIEVIHGVLQNNFYFKEGTNRKLINKLIRNNLLKPVFHNQIDLTNRELEIIQLIYDQKNSHEIAEQLFISVRTVERHRENIILKTNSRNTIGVVIYALTHQLIRW